MDMLKYLNNFTRFSYIPRYCKYKNDQYKTYLQNLQNYLISFFAKINILLDCDKTLQKYETDFFNKFKNKEINKWDKYTYELDYYCKYNDKLFASEGTYNGYIKSKKYKQDFQNYQKNNYTEQQEQQIQKKIQQEDIEIAKSEYLIEMYKNLLHKVFQKTIHRIQRKQSFTVEELQKKMESERKHQEQQLLSLYDKNHNNNNNINNNINNNTNINNNNDIKMLQFDENDEFNIYNNTLKSPSVSSNYDSSDYSENDDITIKKNKKNKKNNNNNNNKNEEEEEEEADDDDDDDDDDDNKHIYNPLNLPLGYDNKPIPYWLYKLHGLSKEYKCEICGNQSYFGRVAFEKHFNEWRHSFGMKCLKIPNTRHFKEITKIEDALKLYEKLKKKSQQHTFKPEQEMECEDSRGNVIDLKTYDDLKWQGLI